MPKEIKETLDMAKERNAETLRIMGEHAFNVDKVLELKKEYTKTEAYIKGLEKALAFKRKETAANSQSSEDEENQKTDFQKAHEFLLLKKADRRYFMFLFGGLFAFVIAGSVAGSVSQLDGCEMPILVLGAFCFLSVVLICSLIYHFESETYEKDLDYLIYLSSKDWVKAIQDNDMKIPFPFTKNSYEDSLKIIAEYEEKHPEKAIRD